MSEALVRTGKISSINYETGKARVVYEDRDNSVTLEIPINCAADTGLIREQDSVLVVHLSNGTEKGIIVGRYHSDSNPPINGKKDLYRKDFSRQQNEAYLQYDEKMLVIEAPDFWVVTKEGREQIVPKLQNHEERIQKLEAQVAELQKIVKEHEARITGLGG